MTNRLNFPATAPAASLRLGFVALTDAAPFIVAHELNFFAAEGLRVQLSREVGWATVRDKIIFGELDAAPVPAPMLWAVQLGLECAAAPVCTAFVANLHGNAITLSNRLIGEGAVDAAALRSVAQKRRGEGRLTFGVVSPFSSHHLHLCHWLRNAGVDPQRDVRIVVVPPAQMFRNLAAGTLDGYCAGEPWNTLAVQEGEGWCPAWSASLVPGHVEKVLMVRQRFADRRASDHAALVRALSASAAWCDETANRAKLPDLLARSEYLNLPATVIAPALAGRFDCGRGRIDSVPDFHVFSRGGANIPTASRAAQLQAELVAAGLVQRTAATPELPRQLFREDLHRDAIANLQATHAKHIKPLRDGTPAPA